MRCAVPDIVTGIIGLWNVLLLWWLDLMFSQRCCWIFKTSGMSCSVSVWVVPRFWRPMLSSCPLSDSQRTDELPDHAEEDTDNPILWNTCSHLLNNTVPWSAVSLLCTWTVQDLSSQQMQNLTAQQQMQSLAFQQPIQGFDGQTQFYLHDQQQAHRRTWAQQGQYPTHQAQQDVRMLWGDPHSPR